MTCMEFALNSHRNRFFLIAMAALFSTGCAVGPNYKRPAAPQVGDYTSVPVTTTSSTPNVTGGEAQHVVEGQKIAGDWWTLFHSKPLNDLVERSLKANPNIKAAQAALVVAKENVRAQ